ncbi:hypothetical protein [Hymenobacter sp. DG25A]|uniref:hypothetical protein n=1 Tax=Hymenobacter sp. DG25A TaxID=1385663 RepID=UPI0006BE0379|nr:hypothetical protein [Hymenobacter sp. DG25A]ALD20980.1 hypothetical protein AM218_06745 [Hymenobacter sp. DG25A]
MRIRHPFAFALVPVAALLTAAGFSTPSAVAPGAPANFTQGIITTRVSLPGNPYDKLLSQIDPTKGNVQAQMQQLAMRMTPAEQQQFQAEAEKINPALVMGAMMLPRKGTIYFRGQEARVSTDGLSYHLENYFDGAKNTGLFLLAAQASPERVAYTYNATSLKKSWQSIVVTEEDYTLKTSTETSLIAGYPSQKATYTLKPGAAAPATNTDNPGEMSQKPVALDVWTSVQIPHMLNFAHPVYVKEKYGITRLVVYFDKERRQKMVYEFASVQLKTITPQDLQIKANTPILDYAKDELQIGMKSLAIMLGGGGLQQSGPSTDDE